MNKITLAEGLSLRSTLTKRISALIRERSNKAAFAKVEKGEQPEMLTRSFELISNELKEVRNDFRNLDHKMQFANTDTVLEWNGKDICLTEAIELAKQIRAELTHLTHYAGFQKETREVDRFSGAANIVSVALYDIEAVRIEAEQLEKQAATLSNLIEKTNWKTDLELSFDITKYLGT